MRTDVVSDEPEVRNAMRAFHKAQELLAEGRTASSIRVYGNIQTSWYGSQVDPRRGSLAYVRVGSDLEEFIGEVVQASTEGRAVLVYVLGAEDLPYDLHMTRTVFGQSLDLLSKEFVRCTIRAFE